MTGWEGGRCSCPRSNCCQYMEGTLTFFFLSFLHPLPLPPSVASSLLPRSKRRKRSPSASKPPKPSPTCTPSLQPPPSPCSSWTPPLSACPTQSTCRFRSDFGRREKWCMTSFHTEYVASLPSLLSLPFLGLTPLSCHITPPAPSHPLPPSIPLSLLPQILNTLLFAALLAPSDRQAYFESVIHGLMVKTGPNNFAHFVKVCRLCSSSFSLILSKRERRSACDCLLPSTI